MAFACNANGCVDLGSLSETAKRNYRLPGRWSLARTRCLSFAQRDASL